MIGSALRSALQTINSKVSRKSHQHSMISIQDVVDEIYRGVFNREPDPVGGKTYRKFLDDGLQNGKLKIAEVLRACIDSPEFHTARQTELIIRADELIVRAEAEEVFKSFTKYQGLGRPGFVTNFLGCVNNIRVSSAIDTLGGVVEDYPFFGNFHGDALEWMGTLKAVLGATDVFRMLELGAGWGPWCVIGYFAAAQRGICDIKVVAVEGDAGHIGFMEENFAENNLRPDAYSIIRGVVGASDGEALFPKAKDPSKVYGGAPGFATSDDDQSPFNFFVKQCSAMIDQVERVPAFSLETVMAEMPIVDLIHCDIQGSELDLFSNAIELVSRKVKRVVIGTHSSQIDCGLMGLFATHGWVLEGAEDCFHRDNLFHDGTQVWRNPFLTMGPPSAAAAPSQS